MQVILQGSLRHFPAAELLSFLCRPERKGTLDVETEGRRTRILFSGQEIVWAEAKNVADPIDALSAALQAAGGSFTLLDSLEVPPNVQPLSLTLDALHEEIRRRAEAGPYRDDTLFRVVENPAQQQVSLSGEEFKILFRLSAGRTLSDLVTDLNADRKTIVERLQKLEELGLVEAGSEAPQDEPQIPTHPFARTVAGDMPIVAPPPTAPIPVQEEAEATRIERATIDRATIERRSVAAEQPVAPERPKTIARSKTMVGSLTPDDAPDSVYPLLDDQCVIGRAAGNGIAIQDGSVSSQHAKLTRTPEGFVIEDLKSRNGTFVNGEKVEQPRLLANGDVVRIGKILMTFNVAQEEKVGEMTEIR